MPPSWCEHCHGRKTHQSYIRQWRPPECICSYCVADLIKCRFQVVKLIHVLRSHTPTHKHTPIFVRVCVCVLAHFFTFMCGLWRGHISFGPICLGFLPLKLSNCFVGLALNVLQNASDSVMTLLCHNHTLIFCFSYLLQMKPWMLFIIPTRVYWFAHRTPNLARFLYDNPSLLFSVLNLNCLNVNYPILLFNYKQFNKPLR